MSIRSNYQHTIYACYIGYIVQAIVNNFAPLLFLTFQSSFGLSLDKVSLLVTLNFGVQLVVDLLSAKFVGQDRLPAVHDRGACAFGAGSGRVWRCSRSYCPMRMRGLSRR